MATKESRAVFVGILVFLILAFVLNLVVQLSFGWSVFIAAVISVVIGILVYSFK